MFNFLIPEKQMNKGLYFIFPHKAEKNIKKIIHTPKTPKMSIKMGYIL
jgi:hypothetical protein